MLNPQKSTICLTLNWLTMPSIGEVVGAPSKEQRDQPHVRPPAQGTHNRKTNPHSGWFANQQRLTPGEPEGCCKSRPHSRSVHAQTHSLRVPAEAVAWKAPGSYKKEMHWLISGCVWRSRDPVEPSPGTEELLGTIFFSSPSTWLAWC